jgi:methylenetetrahydrofolate dehydrogenase (NADP+) / methenyltetrahydrofolate cyclohydrolase
MSKILDGKKLNTEISLDLERKIKKLKVKPRLAIIQIGSVAESTVYIKRKIAFGEKIGAKVEHIKLPSKTKKSELSSIISKLNSDKSVHGIIVQLPLPKHINPNEILNSIDEKKRVDGGKYFLPATTLGILTLLERYKINISGKKVVVIGRSELVGKPTALAMINRGATVTVCHSQTKDLKKETKQADILVVAVGKARLITKNHVSRNQVVIDVGINATADGKLVGDVDFKNVSKIVRVITPVPGGVGPMTVASLFENLLEAYYLQL